MIVPMRAITDREIQVFEMAMDDNRPKSNIIVIINNNDYENFYKNEQVIACTADIKQMGEDRNDILNVVVKAKQRIHVLISIIKLKLKLKQRPEFH